MAINTAGQTLANTYSDGVVKYGNGSVTFDATAITATDYVTITCGFIPRKVVWSNDTDRVMLEWREGMAQDSAIKTAAAGTRTLEVTGGNRGIIVGTGALTSANSGSIPNAGQFQVSQNATLAAILASKVCRWEAWG
jgi:hypothetical protein